MRRRVRPFALVAILAGLAFLVARLVPTEEHRIRKVVERARAAVSSAERPGGPLDAIARLGELTGCLTRDIEVSVDVWGGLSGTISGIDEVRGVAAGIPQNLPGLAVTLSEVRVALEDASHAAVNLVAEARADNRRDSAAQEFKLRMRKHDGRWYIARIETVRSLRPE